MYIIRGSWDMLHLFCGEHGELKELEVDCSSGRFSYVCREQLNSEPCKTKISIEDYEEILSYLSNLIVKAELEGEVPNLTHTTWKTKKKVICRVLVHQKDRIHVMVECKTNR